MMNTAKKDIVIVELSSHEDSFYSHFSFLKDDYNIHLIVNDQLLPLLPTTIPLASLTPVKVEKRKSISISWQVHKLIKKIDPTIVFFHTAQGNIVRELCFLLPKKYKMTGVHHNADKLMSGASFSQRFINRRIKNYFVLADYVKENLQGKIPANISVQDIYTVYYERPKGFHEITKSNKLRIAIPGTVEQSRRDYWGLLEALKKNKLNSAIEFVILGNSKRGDGPELKKALAELGLSESFKFFDAYVSAADMASYMAAADLIMPLLHPGMEYFDLFSKYKISGTFNWAFGYKKPMLMHTAIGSLKTFNDSCITYDMDNLVEKLNSICQNPGQLSQVKAHIDNDPRFDFETQKVKYLHFLEQIEKS